MLFNDICKIIYGTRYNIATTINAEVCLMNWNIGKRIEEDVLFDERADYGKEIIKNLSSKLTEHYGKGWSDRKLLHLYALRILFQKSKPNNQILFF